jgi:predicted lactoylglutathione lyase
VFQRLGYAANDAGNSRDTEENRYAKAMYSTSHGDSDGHVIRFDFHIMG